MTVGPLEPHFGGQGAKMSNRFKKGKWSPWITVSKTVNLLESVEPLMRNRDLDMTSQNEYVYTICCRLEVAGDIISGENVKTVVGYAGYAVLNFEVTSFSSFRDIYKKIISWWRRRRTSTIALSENAFVFHLKKRIGVELPLCEVTRIKPYSSQSFWFNWCISHVKKNSLTFPGAIIVI